MAVLGLQIPEVHNVRFQSLFADLSHDRLSVLVVLDAHPEQRVVRDAKQRLARDLMLEEGGLIRFLIDSTPFLLTCENRGAYLSKSPQCRLNHFCTSFTVHKYAGLGRNP